jgi:4-amino-4-deoxy-L-arabinose transferase-like glycosyltransferase
MQNTTSQHVDGGFGAVVRQHRAWFLIFSGCALLLRLLFYKYFFLTTPDSLVYGNFAKTWLEYHVIGISGPGSVIPADFRLPGYPAYLALCFKIAGIEHYGAACIGQMFVDLGTCFLVSALAWRMAGERAAKWAFALTALCLFFANYASTALTETWSIFFAALALLLATYGADALSDDRRSLRAWGWCGLAIGGAVLLRPDGGMQLIATLAWLGWKVLRGGGPGCPQPGRFRTRVFQAAVLAGVFTFVPLIPWTIRNQVTFHKFQPLPDTTAAGPGEYYPRGFIRWMRTWLVDYASLEDIGFRVGGEVMPFETVPNRAFDSSEERQHTEKLFAAYNDTTDMTPELDAQFADLARQRIRRHPLRFYIVYPVLCSVDMWLRPRTEMLPIDVHWWRYENDPRDSTIAVVLGVLNLALLAAAAWSLRRWRSLRYLGLLLTFVVVRTALLQLFTPPEPRYVLECYPVVLALAGAVRRYRIRT